MKTKKFITSSAVALTLLSVASPITQTGLVFADEAVTTSNTQDTNINNLQNANDTKVSEDEQWNKPVITVGKSLTNVELAGTVAVFKEALSKAKTNAMNSEASTAEPMQLTIDGSTLVKYLNPSMNNYFNNNSGVWSSAMVQKTAKGSGINVKILSYNGQNNITTITANQYRNAALTAGVADADIYVTSAKPIDGSGALAGVYAAFASNGTKLDQEQINLAQQEQSALSQITQDNKGKDGYTDAQLNNAIAQTKQEMANQGDPTKLSNDKIADILDKMLKQNQLDTIINASQRQQIIDLLGKIAQSGVMNKQSFKDQANNLSQSIQDGAKKLFDGLNSEESKGFFKKIGDNISNFFKGIVDWFTSLFNKDDSNKDNQDATTNEQSSTEQSSDVDDSASATANNETAEPTEEESKPTEEDKVDENTTTTADDDSQVNANNTGIK